MKADLYLPTVGLIPNTSYIKPALLSPSGHISPDEYLRVKNVKDVWAVGDISDIQTAQVIHVDAQSTHVAKNLELVLSGKQPVPYNSKGIGMYNSLFAFVNVEKTVADLVFLRSYDWLSSWT